MQTRASGAAVAGRSVGSAKGRVGGCGWAWVGG
jgi:hypothetical protein